MALDFNVEAIPPLVKTLVPTSLLFMLIKSSTQRPYLTGVEDTFSKLNLGYAPLHFPNMSKEKKSTMGSFIHKSSNLG